MPENIKEFLLTEDHIKLLTSPHLVIQENEYETGAPEVDGKHPYGNSFVAGDVAEILGWEYDYRIDEMSEEMKQLALKIHHETYIALQIILQTKSFEPGLYRNISMWPHGNVWEKS